MLDDGQDRAELVRQCLTIGCERLVGEVDGGMDAWRNVAVMCGHGERAATAASLLRRRGARDVAVMLGGPDDWARRHQRALATHP